jgi:hypothetical protein
MEPSSSTLDRPARNALAALIVSAAQGDEPPDGYASRPPLLDTADYGVQAFTFVPDLIFFDLIPDRRGDAETWQWLRRVVAFLRTDLPLARVERTMWHVRQWVGLAGILLIVLGTAAAMAIEAWWPFLASWAAAGAALILFVRHYPQPVSAEVESLGRWAPFRSEAQWMRYRDSVGPDELPRFDAGDVNEDRERLSVAWLLFGVFFGTLMLPVMLRPSHYNVELVDEEG